MASRGPSEASAPKRAPHRGLGALLCVALVLSGCRGHAKHDAPSTPTASVSAASAPLGDAARGQALIAQFECNRCHEGSGAPPAAPTKACVGCHQQILSGTLPDPAQPSLEPFVAPDSIARWQRRIRHFTALPSLALARQRFRRSWLEHFLLEPNDLRPGLEESMPRLALTLGQARDIAACLAPSDPPAPSAPEGSLVRGRALLDQKGCGNCHHMSGVPPLAAGTLAFEIPKEHLEQALKLAPDLALARERLLPGYIERWLTRPSAVDPNTLMPDIPLTADERRDIATYILRAPLGDTPKPEFVRLPTLRRKVTFAELKQRVFRDTCWHCHSDPDYAIGDGGPGNTGGFGFRGRGINLAQHEGVLAGYLDDAGQRKSLFLNEPAIAGGRLVQALLARHAEEAGHPLPGLRGMPLGLPARSAEEIQLVESWIEQGRPL